MPKARKAKRPLVPADFAGDGGPYTEVIVKISIRILDDKINRSRLAVNVYPDPALEPLARKSLKSMEIDSYGMNEHGVFEACLSRHFNGWEDLNKDYPRIDERGKGSHDEECLRDMNAYIKDSVDWALALNKQGMEEAARHTPAPGRKDLVM